MRSLRMKAGGCSPILARSSCSSSHVPEAFWGCRSVLTDHGSVVVLNLYVPNAGGSKKEGGRPRAQAKMRFLYLLQQKVDQLLQGGRKVCLSCSGSGSGVHSMYDTFYPR